MKCGESCRSSSDDTSVFIISFASVSEDSLSDDGDGDLSDVGEGDLCLRGLPSSDGFGGCPMMGLARKSVQFGVAISYRRKSLRSWWLLSL